MSFQLDPRLAADTRPVGDLNLSRLLLHNDSRFPWCVLVPQRKGLRELHELSSDDKLLMWREVDRVSLALQALFEPDKLNVAALGNQVSQLHVHIIARYHKDAAWPAPVWGRGTAQPYPEAAAFSRIQALRRQLDLR